MRLTNTFSVRATPDVAWTALSDLPRMAECIPGAKVVEQDGEVYTGYVDVKVGPVGLTLHGTAMLIECDHDARRMVVKGVARDRKGQGSADALITVTARESAGHTEVNVITDLELGGRIAQFGAGVINKVSSRIIGQFVKRLDAMIAGGGESTEIAATTPLSDVSVGRQNRLPELWFGSPAQNLVAMAAGFFALGVAIGRAVYDRAV